jgi:hypothetical protein
MLPIEPKIGWVFRYSYLWHWQYLEGREEGDKDRPCLVLALVSMREDGTRVVRVLPITHTPPSDPTEAIELPATTKKRPIPERAIETTIDLMIQAGLLDEGTRMSAVGVFDNSYLQEALA